MATPKDTSFIPNIWAKKLLNDFYDNMLLSNITKGSEAKMLWDIFRSEFGETDMQLKYAEHIPEFIKEMINDETETEGLRTGQNFIFLRDWEKFRNAMLLSGAYVDDEGDISVPVLDGWIVIGSGQAVNVGDLNIFFGILNGTYNHEGVAEATKHGNHIKITK